MTTEGNDAYATKPQSHKATKAIVLLCLFSLLATGCSELFPSDNPATIDGKPRASYYQQKAVNDMAAVYGRLPSGTPDRAACMQIMSRFVADPRNPTNLDAIPPLTEAEVDLLADTLNDHPQLVDAVSNIAFRFQQTIVNAVRDVPITVNGNQYFLDEEGYYDLPGGPLHGIEYLQAIQYRDPSQDIRSLARGFYYEKRQVGGRWWDRGCPWPLPLIFFFMDSHRSDTDARRNRITASMNTINQVTGVALAMMGRGPKLFRRTRYTLRVTAWALCILRAVRVRIQHKNNAAGTGSVGNKRWPQLRLNPSVVDTDSVRNDYVRQHELCHNLGMIHEQQRYDRDSYITTTITNNPHNWDIVPRHPSDFLEGGTSTTHDTPYDYNSLMHYEFDSRTTILNPDHETRGMRSWLDNLIQYGHLNKNSYLTPWDIYTIRCMYELSPNPRPDYVPGTDIGRRVVYDADGGTGTPPLDPRLYAQGYTIFVKEPGLLMKPGYVFNGWITVISNTTMIWQPGETFLMPSHEINLKAHWVNQLPRTIYYWTTNTAATMFLRHKFPGGDWSSFPGMTMTFDGTWFIWSKTTNSGYVTVDFISSSGRRDNNGGLGYTVLSNMAWIKDGLVYYELP